MSVLDQTAAVTEAKRSRDTHTVSVSAPLELAEKRRAPGPIFSLRNIKHIAINLKEEEGLHGKKSTP